MLYCKFDKYSKELNDKEMDEQVQFIMDYFEGIKEIRVLVAQSKNFGHQASSINILRALISHWAALRYPKFTVALFCEEATAGEQIEKIKILIPEFKEVDESFDLYGAKVTVILLTKDSELEWCDFGICGGWDDDEQDFETGLARLNVQSYIHLQPYAWRGGSNRIVINDVDNNIYVKINLDEKYPDLYLNRRAFFIEKPKVEEEDWKAIIENGSWNEQEQGKIVKYLVEKAQNSEIEICPVYGIATLSEGKGYCKLINLVSVLLARQDDYKACSPIVVVEIQDLTESDWDNFLAFIDPVDRFEEEQSQDFKTWREKADVVNRVGSYGLPNCDNDFDILKNAVEKLENNHILVAYLGPIPQILFNYLYAQSSLPPVLEGQNTVELMLNLGRPYFKIGRRVEDIRFRYPTLPIDSNTNCWEAIRCDEISKIMNNISPKDWKHNEPANFPPCGLMPIVDAYLNPKIPKSAKLAKYFKKLGEFYHNTTKIGDEIEGKLFLGLNLFCHIRKRQIQVSSFAVAGESDLEKLYNDLIANTHEGVLNLLQAVTSGLAYDFFQRVVNDNVFQIKNADPQINDDKTVVTITGNSMALGVNAALTFKFTQDGNSIATQLQAVFTDASWMLSGAQWLSASSPTLSLTIDRNAVIPISGSFGATITAGFTMQAIIMIPSEAGIALFKGVFTDQKPSITNIFQMVGGINLQAILPQQLQIITDMEVQDLELRYDYTAKKIKGIGINLSTSPERTWQLVPAVQVTGLSLTATIDDPGDLKNRSTSFLIGGNFEIGDGVAFINAAIPQLRVSGGLTDDSPPLTITSIIKVYLGDQFVKGLPDFIKNTQIDKLTFLADKKLGAYSFAMDVKTDWPVDIGGTTLFTITDLGFDINARSKDIDKVNGKAGPKALVIINDQDPKTTEITGNFNGTTIVLPDSANIGLSVLASYGGKDAGWTFKGKTTTPIELGTLLKSRYFDFDPDSQAGYKIDSLSLTIATGDNSWAFTGTASDWHIDFLDMNIKKASLKAGYNGEKNNALALPTLAGSSTALLVQSDNGKGYFANLEAEIEWSKINITTWIKFRSQEKPSWGFTLTPFSSKPDFKLQATVEQNKDKQWVGTLKFTEGVTLGSMIEIMVSWITGSKFGLEAPWNFLDSISLSNLAFEYNFTTKNVNFKINIGPINLGFARIDSIDVNYQSGREKEEENGVMVTLSGSFPWNIGDEAVGDTGKLGPWDASKPGSAPAAPGSGNKYFDLRLLALGQHVTTDCFRTADTVQKAIACLADMPLPKEGKIPVNGNVLKFDAGSSWLIGADFGILKLGKSKEGGDKTEGPALYGTWLAPLAKDEESGYLLTMQIVFNDPYLYALRIALAGEAAKIFKGLDFQILYRQISDTVGVYQAEITLPDLMRHLSVGAYSITLPVFAIAIYTNGDFFIDIGFPWDADFSRSFTIEGIIAPGIPVLGSAGLYFGKLSSDTTKKVPQATNGNFNPVIVFGFGLQVGFGKSIEYGILKAGFSVTFVGIIEGILAKWNPYPLTDDNYQLTDDGNNDSQIQGAYYFWLRGTVGIVGKLYGSIDFAVIKAAVNLTIKLLLQLTYESYVSITMTIIVSVDVSVSIEINLGLFKLKVHFSFAMRLKETFTIENHEKPPWQIPNSQLQSLLRAPADHRLRAAREITARAALAVTARPAANWLNLKKPAEQAPLLGYLAPALTVAHDEWQTTGQELKDQMPCYVAMLFIDSVPPANRDVKTSRLKAAGQESDSSFEALCKMVLRWVIAAIQSQPMTIEQVDQLVINELDLTYLIEEVLISTKNNPMPIPEKAIETFLANQFRLTVQVPNREGEADTTYFPMAPALKLDIPKYGDDYPGYSYTFSDYNTIDDKGLLELREYFDELAVQVQSEMGRQDMASLAETDGKSLSMASWVFTDYFLLIARQMVQAVREGLRDFKYEIKRGQCPDDIIQWINETGKLTGNDAYTLYELFEANRTHPLTTGKGLTIGGGTYRVTGTQSFTTIAGDVFGQAFTDLALATVNASRADILQVGQTITYSGRSYTTQTGDSLDKIAVDQFNTPLGNFLIGSNVLSQGGILVLGAKLYLPLYAAYQTLTSDTFDTIATLPVYGNIFTSAELATQNALKNILRPGQKITYPDKDPYITQPGDTLNKIATTLGLSLSEFLSKSSVLTQENLLMPLAILDIPPFDYTIRNGDDLQSITGRFNFSLNNLAYQESNGTIQDLFAIASDSPKDNFLDIPHLVQFQVAQLVAEAQRVLALQHLSGMTSRYYLHGLRLPTTWVTPNQAGMWVQDEHGTLKLPPRAGLYALTGQQFPLPVIQGEAGFKITFDRSGGPEWLLFTDDADQLSMEISPGSIDAVRIESVAAYARGNRLDINLTQLGAEKMYESELVSYPFTSALVWQSAAAVKLPYLLNGKPPEGVPTLCLWKLPDAMINLPDPAGRAINPRFSIKIARYDEATGGTINTPVNYYAWASTIKFTVKKIPSDTCSPTTESTYEIVGANRNSIILMERLLDQVQGKDTFFDQVILGYPPDQTGDATEGVQTDPVNAVTMGVAQVNLSTETRPPVSVLGALAVTEEEATGLGLLNRPSEFIRLLWEASITSAGGFYLYYYNTVEGSGLPDRVFNDKGEAGLTLILLYARPSSETEQNRLTDFMNAFATGESIDTSGAVVFAQADPPSNPPTMIKSTENDTLASIAYGYYSNVADMAQANAGMTITSGKLLEITKGLFQALPGGIGLADVAERFGTTVQALQDANLGNLPDPLPYPTAIRLPRLTVTVGASPVGNTLEEIANFYGEGITCLAAHNQNVTGLFAGRQVTIPGGPRVRNATVSPGVAAVAAMRPVPPEVPERPDGQDFARKFLLNTYSLLNYQVAENVYFKESKMGLPAGPTTKPEDPENKDKIRVPKILSEQDNWDYKQSLPYPKFAKLKAVAKDDLPNPSRNPYIGVGYILQVAFNWQDYYGNTLVTKLSNPQSSDKGPLNMAPILTGYTDALIGLGQWPSVSSNWQVVPDGEGLPKLELMLTFDNSPYQGLIAAKADNEKTVLLTFTEKLDASSATKKENYSINNNITVEKALLGADKQTVELTVSILSDGDYTISVKDINNEDRSATFQGRAGFSYPDMTETRFSTIQEKAQKDLRVYTQLYFQLTDPNSVAYTIETSLLKGRDSSPGAIELTKDQVLGVLNWLFNNGNSIYKFLQDRADFNTSVSLPQAQCKIQCALAGNQLNDKQIFELSLSFLIERTGGAVLGDLETTSGIRKTSTRVAPLTQKLEGSSNGNNTLGLKQFACNFQKALSRDGEYLMNVATGVNRNRISTVHDGSAVWAVRLGLTPSEAISYWINNPNNPTLFAPRPISNQLHSRKDVAIYDYQTGKGLSPTVTRTLDFIDIDLDLWGRQFFSAIDSLLTSEFTASIQIVGKHEKSDYLQKILDQKKALANIIKLGLINVFAEENTDASHAQEVFYQQLLSRLSNAYSTRAAIQFTAIVKAEEDGQTLPPRLFGNIVQNGPKLEAVTVGPDLNQISVDRAPVVIELTSPKLDLKTSNDQPVTFLLTAPDTIKGGGDEVLAYVDLDLSYNGSSIEHQIGSVWGIQGYLASSWLSFVIQEDKDCNQDTSWPLKKSLGHFKVPMVLRAFPASPTMSDQTGTASDPNISDLSEVTLWDYSFTYALSFHYPQDRIYCQVDFNIADMLEMTAGFEDAFNQLAQFITVFPEVKKDLVGLLATIDATTSDQETIDNAAVALQAFIKMVSDVIDATQEIGLVMAERPKPFTSKNVEPFNFYIQECSVNIGSTQAALLVTLVGELPEGISPPVVYIDPENYDPVPYKDKDCNQANRFCFIYKKKSGKDEYLSAEVGQTIPDRQVILPKMNILQRQDAWSTVYITRNEELVPSKKTAKEFVYKTPYVQFANALHPTIDSSTIISIATIGSSGNPPPPITRSLREHLETLFKTLLKNNTEPLLIFQVENTYDYAINTGFTSVPQPVLMQRPLLYSVGPKLKTTASEASNPHTVTQGNLEKMISEWTEAIELWFSTYKPRKDRGTLWFDLTIMSNLTKQPMPLLRLRKLKLEIEYIENFF